VVLRPVGTTKPAVVVTFRWKLRGVEGGAPDRFVHRAQLGDGELGRAEGRAQRGVLQLCPDPLDPVGEDPVMVEGQRRPPRLSTSDGQRERQSSSGVVVGTGTGATGWLASIAHQRLDAPALPGPEDPALCWFVREAWPSPATGVTLTAGRLGTGDRIELTSEGERLVVFADGLEPDRLDLAWGQRVTIGLSERHLRLVL
jgi:hypothetical protein